MAVAGVGGERAAVPDGVMSAAIAIWGALESQHAIPVRGQSMWPTLRDGDRIWIAHSRKGVGRGDVIVYRLGRQTIVHRVVGVDAHEGQPCLLTQGDHRTRTDPPVLPEQVLGRVIAVERRGHSRKVYGGPTGALQGGCSRMLARLMARLGQERK